MAINERQRMQYLDALGIESYMPRVVLPSAPSIKLCANVVNADTSVPEAAVQAPVGLDKAAAALAVSHTPAESLPVTGVAPIADASPLSQAPKAKGGEGGAATLAVLSGETSAEKLVDKVDEKVSSDAEVSRESLEVRQAKAAEMPKFSLGLWQFGEQLLVVDSRRPEQALPTEQLLLNIVLALGYPRQPLPKAHVVRWPIVENRFEEQGENEARDMLSALMEARLESQPVKYVLLMGEEACHYVLSPEQVGDSQAATLKKRQGQLLVCDNLHEGQSVIVVPSLTDMLQDTSLKKVTWQAIQPLRQ